MGAMPAWGHKQKLLQLLTLLARVRFRAGHFHIVGGDETSDTIEFSFPPVGVALIQHVDDLILGEGELVLVRRRVVVQSNNLSGWERTEGKGVRRVRQRQRSNARKSVKASFTRYGGRGGFATVWAQLLNVRSWKPALLSLLTPRLEHAQQGAIKTTSAPDRQTDRNQPKDPQQVS